MVPGPFTVAVVEAEFPFANAMLVVVEDQFWNM